MGEPLITTADVVDEIWMERQRQDERWGKEHDAAHTRTDWSWLLQARLAEALDPATDDARYRRLLTEVAAITVAAAEVHDRRGGRTLR